jgi:diguanylate cyclase (GGDEF)-like protein
MSAASRAFAVWLRRSDHHYQWSTSYLQARDAIGVARTTTALTALGLGLIPLAMLASTAPSSSSLGTVMAILGGAGALAGALLFATRWPSERQSVAFALTATASIALSSLAQSNPHAAMLACAAFAIIAGYIALFHAAPLMVANLVVAVGVSVLAAIRIAHAEGVVQALCACSVVLILNLTVPVGLQVVVHALSAELLKADHDSLTGALSRRAFYRSAYRLGDHPSAAQGGHVLVAMVDLDRFKNLNDRYGHRRGDEALVAVGSAMRAVLPPDAILGRVGGEEFLVAGVFATPQPRELGQGLCRAVSALPYKITASIGTAVANAADLRANGVHVINALVAAADAAMYEAKRGGGNQTRHDEQGASRWPTTLTAS